MVRKRVTTATTHEAKTHLSRLLRQVAEGEEVVILSGKEPVARLVKTDASDDAPKRPSVGTVTAELEVDDQAFEPLSEPELADWGV